ncbi:hypothetical protein FA95DRAFT_1565470, partial [Auriscalpium vulgare]
MDQEALVSRDTPAVMTDTPAVMTDTPAVMADTPPPPQLLTKLLTDTREYQRHLFALDTHARHLMQSLSAYVSIAPTSAARSVLAAATTLGSADDALWDYAHSLGTGVQEMEIVRVLEERAAKGNMCVYRGPGFSHPA